MRTYIAAPDTTRDEGSDIPLFRITVATNVSATEAYTIAVPDKHNRYMNALTLSLTDDECDLLLEQLAAARAERIAQQEAAYEALHAKFGGAWDNPPTDRTDPDGDFTPLPLEEV